MALISGREVEENNLEVCREAVVGRTTWGTRETWKASTNLMPRCFGRGSLEVATMNVAMVAMIMERPLGRAEWFMLILVWKWI
mmetsp:Transcript_19944/g.55463  ORF Transcript_19944/g.55463 Transcript_19944/m.55463 type:complete len:83 (-) Transcript_19944:48-296(-)